MTRDQIIARAAVASRPVPFEDSEFPIFLRPLMADERTEAVAWQKVHGEDVGFQFLFVRSVCDADGKRLFADEDAPLIGSTFPVAMVEAVVDEVLKTNRMGQYQKKALSTATPNSSSPSV